MCVVNVADAGDGSATSSLRLPPSSDSVAPVTMTGQTNEIGSFFDGKKIAAMHQDDGPELIHVRFGAWRATAPAACRNRWGLFERNGATFARSSKVKLVMPYIRCLENLGYVARLSTPVILSKTLYFLSDQVRVYYGL